MAVEDSYIAGHTNGFNSPAQAIIRRDLDMIHRYEKPTEVKIRDGKPCAFQIDGTWETIQEIIDSWVIETLWWEKTGTVRRYYFSVFTSWYGVYELYLQDGQWILSGDLD